MATTAQLVANHAAQSGIAPVMLIPGMMVGTAILAYLIGSIPFGIILARMFNVGDLRQIGSGNIGATNMLRAGGKNLAIATLILDMAKGFLAVMICTILAKHYLEHKFSETDGIQFDVSRLYYFFGLYAVIGHVWPVWLNFKGGKGVATALGALLATTPLAGVFAIACWLITFFVTRYSSLSALVAIGFAPFACFLTDGRGAAMASLIIALIVFWRHKPNITRLINGTEPKSDVKKL